MKIGIIGLGSIGKRHIDALGYLGIKDIIALRTNRGELIFTNDELQNITECYDLDKFLSYKLDGIIISNPTSLHAITLDKILDTHLPTFIEKPIFSNLGEIGRSYLYKENIIVGYCFRFSKTISKVKSLLITIGDIKLASFYRSFYLPFWHPYADYSKEYTAKKELGGGVIRTLSHEIDLMLYLFGDKLHSCIGYIDKVSNLNIDTDDIAFFSCKYDNGVRVNFELDFLGAKYVNNARFIGEKGNIFYDYNTKSIYKILYDGTSEYFTIDDRDISDMYIDQMKDFLNFITNKISLNASFDQSIKVLEIINKIENMNSNVR